MKRCSFRRPPIFVRFSIVSTLIVHFPMTQSGGVRTMNDCQRGPTSSTDFDFSSTSPLVVFSSLSPSFVSSSSFSSWWDSVSGGCSGGFVGCSVVPLPSIGSMSMMTSCSVVDLSVLQSFVVSTSRQTLQLANLRPSVTSNEKRFSLLTFVPSPAVRSRHKARDNHLTMFIFHHCISYQGICYVPHKTTTVIQLFRFTIQKRSKCIIAQRTNIETIVLLNRADTY